MDDRNNRDASGGSIQAPKKKPYVQPVLQEWGSFQDLTLTVGSRGRSDGGKQSGRKSTRV